MKKLFDQSRGSTAHTTNMISLARSFGLHDSEVVYAKAGTKLVNVKGIYDNKTSTFWLVPELVGSEIFSFYAPVLVTDKETIDLTEHNIKFENYHIKHDYSFSKGFEITNGTQVVIFGDFLYRWDGTLPKTVPAGSTPESTGGIGMGTWVSVGDASLRNELKSPSGTWFIGRASTLQDLLKYDVKVGWIYETDGYYSVGDKGSAKYLISDTKGDIPELAYECENGLYAILQHNGTITLEQLGAKGVALGQTATEDSWPAFYKAYQIKRAHVWNLSVEFVAGNSAYFCSKPVLMTTGMTLRTPNTSWICKIIYGGEKVTKAEVPDIKGTDKDDGVIFYSDIKAQVIFVHSEGFSCYYSKLDGFSFNNSKTADPIGMYGVYAPYLAKVNIHNCRFNEVNYGIRWINYWNGSLKQTLFSGITTGTTAPVNSVGVWSEPYNGINSYTNCGTSLTFECVGVTWFQAGYKICNLVYSNFNGCYSEMAVDRAIEFIGCAGITVSTFGLENLKNTLYSTIRFNNAQVTMNNLVFAYNNEFSGGNVVFVNNRSKVNMAGCSFGRLKNTGTSSVLFNITEDSELSIDGPVNIPASIISSPGYSFATVSGKLYSEQLFSKTVGVANGSSTSNAVTFTMNEFSYKFKGGSVWFNYTASWTGGSGSDMQIYGFPKKFIQDTLFTAVLPSAGKAIYARTLVGTDRIRLQSITDASYVSIPATGLLNIQGEYLI